MFKGDSFVRRDLLRIAGCVTGALALAQDSPHASRKKPNGEEEVSPGEELMQEHGVLKRVLLAYREVIRRIDANEDFPPETIQSSAKVIRTFIQEYHEEIEEHYLFPRFRKANRLVELVDVLDEQHHKGRTLTDQTMKLATPAAIKDSNQRASLRDGLYQFVRMYEPHEAREDIVLFPAFRQIVSKNEYDSLGEEFEKKEHQLFGEGGFEKMVEEVARIEKQLGIYDLGQFTPKV